MSTTNHSPKAASTDAQTLDNLDDRDIRALITPMTTLDDIGYVRDRDGQYSVTTDSGSEYTVDIHAETCTCPDHEYRGVKCKHIRRVEFETGLVAIPADVSPAMLDDQLGMHIGDGEPRFAMTDGGVAEARVQTETGTDSPVTSTASKLGFVIGVDGKGDAHVHYPAANMIKVYNVGAGYDVGDRLDEDDIVLEQALEASPLAHWMSHVDDKRGWDRTTHRAPEEFQAEGGEK